MTWQERGTRRVKIHSRLKSGTKFSVCFAKKHLESLPKKVYLRGLTKGERSADRCMQIFIWPKIDIIAVALDMGTVDSCLAHPFSFLLRLLCHFFCQVFESLVGQNIGKVLPSLIRLSFLSVLVNFCKRDSTGLCWIRPPIFLPVILLDVH